MQIYVKFKRVAQYRELGNGMMRHFNPMYEIRNINDTRQSALLDHVRRRDELKKIVTKQAKLSDHVMRRGETKEHDKWEKKKTGMLQTVYHRQS